MATRKKKAAKLPRVSKATYRARLVRLLALTGEINPHTFNMGLWCDAEKGCGTIGCLGGHAALLPEFQAQGLNIDPKTEEITYYGRRAPGGNVATLRRFFGLNGDESHRLFMAWSNRIGTDALVERASVVLDLLHNDPSGLRSRKPRIAVG